MTDINRLKKLSGINESDDLRLKKIRNGINNYIKQENDHHWPYGFEYKMSEFIVAELDKEEPVDNSPKWGDRS
jgi:hypothetical protein